MAILRRSVPVIASEAKQSIVTEHAEGWIASSLSLLAMTDLIYSKTNRPWECTNARQQPDCHRLETPARSLAQRHQAWRARRCDTSARPRRGLRGAGGAGKHL